MDFVTKEVCKLDFTKINTIEDIKLILDCLEITVHKDGPAYARLKHLLIEENKIVN